jgi:hypothetical protein
MPLAFALTGGERHDLIAVPELLDGTRLARTLVVADRSYDADGLRSRLLLHDALLVASIRTIRKSLRTRGQPTCIAARWSNIIDRTRFRTRLCLCQNKTRPTYLRRQIAGHEEV